MDREGFLDTVRKELADEINSAYLQCEHGGGQAVDWPALNARLRKLMAHAESEGISANEFRSLVRASLPEAASRIDLGGNEKLAA